MTHLGSKLQIGIDFAHTEEVDQLVGSMVGLKRDMQAGTVSIRQAIKRIEDALDAFVEGVKPADPQTPGAPDDGQRPSQ